MFDPIAEPSFKKIIFFALNNFFLETPPQDNVYDYHSDYFLKFFFKKIYKKKYFFNLFLKLTYQNHLNSKAFKNTS